MCSWMKISFEGALEKKLENKDAAACTSEFFGFWICSRTSQGHIVTTIPHGLWCLQCPKGKTPSDCRESQHQGTKVAAPHLVKMPACSPSSHEF